MRYSFGDVVLDTERFELLRGGEPVHVEPQVFAVLTVLLERRHRVVAKTELLDEVWGDRFVSESALTSRIKAARHAVGDDGTAQQVIRTVHSRGHQIVAEVTEDASEPGGDDLRRPASGPGEPADPRGHLRQGSPATSPDRRGAALGAGADRDGPPRLGP